MILIKNLCNLLRDIQIYFCSIKFNLLTHDIIIFSFWCRLVEGRYGRRVTQLLSTTSFLTWTFAFNFISPCFSQSKCKLRSFPASQNLFLGSGFQFTTISITSFDLNYSPIWQITHLYRSLPFWVSKNGIHFTKQQFPA